jgi:hypothetical protein
VPFVMSGSTRTTRKFGRRRSLRIMSSRDSWSASAHRRIL